MDSHVKKSCALDYRFGAQTDAELFSHGIAQLPQVGPGKLPIGRICPKHEGWRSRLSGVFGGKMLDGSLCARGEISTRRTTVLLCASLRAMSNGLCADSTCFANLHPARIPDPSLSDILDIAPGPMPPLNYALSASGESPWHTVFNTTMRRNRLVYQFYHRIEAPGGLIPLEPCCFYRCCSAESL